jgi:CelD/BcsL family acetyltransferase involved in cellulose biosynthesis
MPLTTLSKVKPTREQLPEVDGLSGSVRYRIQVNSLWFARYLESFHCLPSAFLLEIRDGESKKLVGAMPLETQTVRNERGWKMRQLVPLAGGQSDFHPFLCLPGYETEFARHIVHWLAGHRQEWDSLRMNVIPQSSRGWAELVDALAASGFSPKVSRDRFFYKVNTDGRWEDYEKNFLHRRMDTVRNLTNQMTRDCGGKEVRILEQGIDNHLEEFVAWYRQRREATEQKDAFENYPEKLGFLRSVIRDFEPRGLVRLSMLSGGGDTLAYQLDWLDQGIWYYYMPAFNDRFARYSPSKILLYETMKLAFHDPKIHEFNFMRGEEPYKAQFADEKEAFISIRVPNPWSFRFNAIAFLSRLVALRDRIIR